MNKTKGYVTEKELKEAIIKLDNAQDQFILMAIYNGIAGKKSMSELLSLKSKDVDFEKHIIKVEDREIVMDEYFERITREAIEQSCYYNEVSSKHSREEIELNTLSEYVIKTMPRAKNDMGLAQMKYDTFRRRFQNIIAKLDIQITPSEIETAGIINKYLLSKKDTWTVADISFEFKLNNISLSAYRVYSVLKEINN